MIFETFTLSKNSWHVKLMKYIWKWDHDNFPNMCPYFWISICNVIIFPFVFIIKLVITVIDKLNSYHEAQHAYTIKKEAEYFKNLIINHQDATFADYARLLYILNNADESYHHAIIYHIGMTALFRDNQNRHKYSNEFIIQHLNKTPFLYKFKEYINEIEDRNHTKKELKPTDLCKYYKPIGAVILILLGVLGLYYVIGWIIKGVTLIDWILIKQLGIASIILAGIFICVYIISVVLGTLILKLSNRFPTITINMKWFDKYIIDPCVCALRGVNKFFQILHQLYKNNCPGIDWKQ